MTDRIDGAVAQRAEAVERMARAIFAGRLLAEVLRLAEAWKNACVRDSWNNTLQSRNDAIEAESAFRAALTAALAQQPAHADAVERACAAELAEFFYPANPPYRSKEAMAEDMALVIARHFRAALPTMDSAKDGWRPIDSAPKDGTRVLLAWRAFGGFGPHVELGKHKAGVGWCNTYGKFFSGAPDLYMPLPEVQPLPAAPKETNR